MIDIDDNHYINVVNWGNHQNLDRLEKSKKTLKTRSGTSRKKKQQTLSCNVTCNDDVTDIDKDLDKDLDLDLDKEIKMIIVLKNLRTAFNLFHIKKLLIIST